MRRLFVLTLLALTGCYAEIVEIPPLGEGNCGVIRVSVADGDGYCDNLAKEMQEQKGNKSRFVCMHDSYALIKRCQHPYADHNVR